MLLSRATDDRALVDVYYRYSGFLTRLRPKECLNNYS
jgi:hypothetical protein